MTGLWFTARLWLANRLRDLARGGSAGGGTGGAGEAAKA